MELILKKDVENLGFTDDIVTVKNGYGRNFLLPQGYAVLATPSTKKVLAETLKQRASRKENYWDAQKRSDKLNWLEIKIASNRVKETNYLDLFLMQIFLRHLQKKVLS